MSIPWTLTVTRLSDGSVRTRTDTIEATLDEFTTLYWNLTEGSLGSDCNHDILFNPSLIDDDSLVDDPAVSAYSMALSIGGSESVDLRRDDAYSALETAFSHAIFDAIFSMAGDLLDGRTV